MDRALSEPIDVRPLVRDMVGARSLAEEGKVVCTTMLEEALAWSLGARSGAVRRLEVARQLILYLLKH